jgi:hypothetical protein
MATGWHCQDGNVICLPLICLQIIFYFRVLGYANLFKLASADQFAKTDQNNQRGHDASRDASHHWAHQRGGLDRDANCVLPSTQMDQDRPFASVECVSPLDMP